MIAAPAVATLVLCAAQPAAILRWNSPSSDEPLPSAVGTSVPSLQPFVGCPQVAPVAILISRLSGVIPMPPIELSILQKNARNVNVFANVRLS